MRELIPETQRKLWKNARFWWKKEYLWVKPLMTAFQAGHVMCAAEEQQTAEGMQYNHLVTQFPSGHTASHDSISNLTATNAPQQ
jgi:hypothetical protein